VLHVLHIIAMAKKRKPPSRVASRKVLARRMRNKGRKHVPLQIKPISDSDRESEYFEVQQEANIIDTNAENT
jgi:hypothetical protein